MGPMRGERSSEVVLCCVGQHHCYSMTKKNRWESYTVEKGCKKIDYCRSQRENMPAVWTLPWNFCCDRARCNAKLGHVACFLAMLSLTILFCGVFACLKTFGTTLSLMWISCGFVAVDNKLSNKCTTCRTNRVVYSSG